MHAFSGRRLHPPLDVTVGMRLDALDPMPSNIPNPTSSANSHTRAERCEPLHSPNGSVAMEVTFALKPVAIRPLPPQKGPIIPASIKRPENTPYFPRFSHPDWRVLGDRGFGEKGNPRPEHEQHARPHHSISAAPCSAIYLSPPVLGLIVAAFFAGSKSGAG